MTIRNIHCVEPPTAAVDPEDGFYVVPNDWGDAQHRLGLLETWADPATIRRLESIGVGSGWRCLEVGAGGGSITRWLCEHVGQTGQVTAVDMDTRFLDQLDCPNLEVRRQDVVAEAVGGGGYDLVHCRALLTHLHARGDVLADLIAALRPGGCMLVEEIDFFPIHACGSDLYRDVLIAMEAALEPAGVDCRWARNLPALLDAAGLDGVAADADVQFFIGGSPAAQFLDLSFVQLRDILIARGCAAAELDRFSTLLRDPESWFPNMTLIGASGRAPAGAIPRRGGRAGHVVNAKARH